jgi:hypothetical protein
MQHNGIATSRQKTAPRQNPQGAVGHLRAQKKCHTVQSLLRANSLITNKSDAKEASHFSSGTDTCVCGPAIDRRILDVARSRRDPQIQCGFSLDAFRDPISAAAPAQIWVRRSTDRSVCATQPAGIKWDTVPLNFPRISLKTNISCTKQVRHFFHYPKRLVIPSEHREPKGDDPTGIVILSEPKGKLSKPLALDTSLSKLHLSAPDAKFNLRTEARS